MTQEQFKELIIETRASLDYHFPDSVLTAIAKRKVTLVLSSLLSKVEKIMETDLKNKDK